MDGDSVRFLETWFKEQCDDDWEHSYKIEMGTLDNPGWRLRVDVRETDLEGLEADWVKVDRSEDDWVHHHADGRVSEAFGGAQNLVDLFDSFRLFATATQRAVD